MSNQKDRVELEALATVQAIEHDENVVQEKREVKKTTQEGRKKAEKAPAPAKAKRSVHDKHRQRVFQEIAEYGLDGLSEHRVLEYVLFFCIPRCDTNEIAHALIAEFGSFSAVLEAAEEDLCKVAGIGPASARFLHALPAIDRYYGMNKMKKRKSFLALEQQVSYFLPLFRSETKEVFCMMTLDARGQLLGKTILGEGSIGAVEIDIRKLVSIAFKQNAAQVVFAHNHPNGLAVPSREDIKSTGDLMRALGMFDIYVLDHIIVAGESYCSLANTEQWPVYDRQTKSIRYFYRGK